MIELTKSPEANGAQAPSRERPPLRPSWLYAFLTLFVIAAHVAFFASGIYWPRTEAVDIASINAELLPEGDSLEVDAMSEGDAPAGEILPVAELDEPEAALPPPIVVEPEAPPPEKKEIVETVKEKELEKKRLARRLAERAERRREARAAAGVSGGRGQGTGQGTGRGGGGRFGVPGGRGQGQGGAVAQAACLARVAASIRSHTPGHTSLGPGTVYVTFHVNSGGGISGVSASGGSPAHAALARRIVASSRGPSNCSPAFASQGITFQ